MRGKVCLLCLISKIFILGYVQNKMIIKVNLKPGYEIEIELLTNTLRLKRQITEVSSRERPRLAGRMKSSVLKDGTRFLWRTALEYFRQPQRKD